MLFEGGCYRRKQLTKLFHPGVQDQIIISAVPVQTDLAPQDTKPVDCRVQSDINNILERFSSHPFCSETSTMKFLSTLVLVSTSLSNNNIIGGHAKEHCVSRSTYLGCYENRNQDRALPYEMKGREYTARECELACASRGYLYFAREWMGQVSVHMHCSVFLISPLFTHIFSSRFYFVI